MNATPQAARGRVGHLSRHRRLAIYAVSLTVWITGALWLIYHYFLKTEDSFGFENPRPEEKWWLTTHALASFYALWWFGLLWPNHIKRSWNTHVRRGTGGLLFACTAWLCVTGCALYYLVNDRWRSWDSILHWAVGLAALAAFALHLLTRTPRAP